MTTIAADPSALRRFGNDSTALLAGIGAESAALADALTRLAGAAASSGAAPRVLAPLLPAPPVPAPPPLPPAPAMLATTFDDLGRALRQLQSLAAAAQERFLLADTARSLLAPPNARKPLGRSPLGAVLRTLLASSVARAAHWAWLDDLWEALESGATLAHLAAPGALISTHLAELVDALRTAFGMSGGELGAVLPVVGTAAATALTAHDLATVEHDGDPVHAFHQRGVGYFADVLQVAADAGTAACAQVPSPLTCGPALVTDLDTLTLRVWHRHPGIPMPLLLPGMPPVVVPLAPFTDLARGGRGPLEKGVTELREAGRRAVDDAEVAADDTIDEGAHLVSEAWSSRPGWLR